jgi:surface antigen
MEAQVRQVAFAVGLMLVCSGCAETSVQPAIISQVTTSIPPGSPDCRDYTAKATLDGKTQPLLGRACRQSDGSWRIVEGTPKQPLQFVAVYPPPYADYPYDGGWFWGPPIGLSLGAVVFVDRFHDFGRFHRFEHGQFHGAGFGHGGTSLARGGMGHFHGGGFGHGGMGHR